MSRPRRRSSGVVVIVGLLGVCVLLWSLRAAIDPPPSAPATAVHPPAATAPRTTPTSAALPTTPPPLPELPAPREAPDLRGHDAVDPCTAGFEPMIPSGFDTTTAEGITVAWQDGTVRTGPYDVAVQPTAIAYLVNGVLAEAATLTGTPRRERLTVVIYPTRSAYLTATHAPTWSDGVYDGGAVRVPPQPTGDLGVGVAHLRHELMHAQLHATVGCMPAWFNEGVAMYFGGTPPVRAWIRMLRAPDAFDLRTLAVPSFVAMPDEQAARAYAESLAMIVALVERSGELGLRSVVQRLRDASRAGAELDLWERLYPDLKHRELLDVLARKLFGIGLGVELDGIVRGAVCCYGLRAIHELACRGTAPRPERKRWVEQLGTRMAACDAAW